MKLIIYITLFIIIGLIILDLFIYGIFKNKNKN